ncbi:hypothetical protein Lal_00041938, partial [Lupinus albus]
MEFIKFIIKRLNIGYDDESFGIGYDDEISPSSPNNNSPKKLEAVEAVKFLLTRSTLAMMMRPQDADYHIFTQQYGLFQEALNQRKWKKERKQIIYGIHNLLYDAYQSQKDDYELKIKISRIQ